MPTWEEIQKRFTMTYKMEKNIGTLIDELSVLNIKIFMEMEKDGGSLDIVKTLNRQRSDVKNAINRYFKESEEVKTYE